MFNEWKIKENKKIAPPQVIQYIPKANNPKLSNSENTDIVFAEK